jgi:glutathione peroxidase-family protein
MVHEAQRWVREHTVDAEVEGSVDVVWGFYVFRVDDEGSVFEHFESVVEGKARRR